MILRYPLSWYVGMLEARQPFVSLLYGDGEWLAALRERTGSEMQNGEIITKQLEDAMLDSLKTDDPSIIYGSDPFLIDYETYEGGDKATIHEIGRKVRVLLDSLQPKKWVDGVVWEQSVRNGQLGPLIKVLRNRQPALVGCPLLSGIGFLNRQSFQLVPAKNCAAVWQDIADQLIDREYTTPDPVIILCVGLSAIPMAMRLHEAMPQATILDLGSTFDVFVKLGAQRGWREEMYNNVEAWKTCVSKNLEGVIE